MTVGIALVGIGSNVGTIAAVDLALVAFLCFGLFAFVPALLRGLAAAAGRLRRTRP
jgi:hypothetical protein